MPLNCIAEENDFEDTLLILEPNVQTYVLEDYAYIYENNGKFYISLPQLASYTGFKTEKVENNYHISWALPPKDVIVDYINRKITADGTETPFEPNDAEYMDDTLFVSDSFLERIFGIKMVIDHQNMCVNIDSDESFPTTIKKNLEKNRAGGLYSYQRDTFEDYTFDNRLFATPVLDVTLNKGWTKNKSTTTNSDSYILDFVGLIGGLDVSAYVAGYSENNHEPTVRLTGSREFLDEPPNALHLKKMEIGDVSGISNSYFTAASYGRGVTLSSFKDLILSADKTIDLTGPLQEGWQVELYWNDQLLGYRQDGVAGQYHFENIPVSYGLNTFKLVFYGPYGETKTEIKRYYSGTSPVKKGEFGYTIDAYQPDRYLIEDNRDIPKQDKSDKAIFDMTGYYGLSDNFTLMGGYTKTPDEQKQYEQNFGMTGAQYAIDGLSVQYNLEQNLDTKRLGQHIEAQGDVYIGSLYAAIDNFNKIHSPISERGDDYMADQYEARLNGLLPYNIPYYLSYKFGSYEDSPQKFQDVSTRVSKQLSNGINATIENIFYTTTHGGEDTDDVQFGLYKYWGSFSTEAWLMYSVLPESEFKQVRIRGDWRTGRRTYLSAEYTRDLQEDIDALSVSAGRVFSFGGLTLTFKADTKKNLSAYLTYNISFAKEPNKAHIFATGNSRFGETGSIYATLKDENGNPLEGVGLNANGVENEVYTDSKGTALLQDMQPYQKTILTINKETLPDIALSPDEDEKKLVLRPGTITEVTVPFTHKGAIEGKVENPNNRLMFGYEIIAYDPQGEKVLSTFTDTDGYFVLEGLKYETYSIVINKDGEKLNQKDNIIVNDIVTYIDDEIELPKSAEPTEPDTHTAGTENPEIKEKTETSNNEDTIKKEDLLSN